MNDIEQWAEMVTDLRAIVIYLRVIGAVYPVAPEQAIETIERVIDALKEMGVGDELQNVHDDCRSER